MDVRILGPLEVWVDERQVDLGGRRQRALLAILALNANEVVSTDRLIDLLWSGEPPATALKALQNVVSQLRRALGREAGSKLETRAPGYVLRVDGDELDARRFERLAADARALLDSDPERAARRLRDALALWRGEPLAEFAYDEFARAEAARLDEARLVAVEDRLDAQLALGRSGELVPELEALVRAHPLRERLRGQLMLALYRSGRQADALEAYREGAAALREGLGLEPGAGLRQLERAILAQDPELGPTPRLPRPPRRRRRRRLLAVAVAVAAVTAVVAALATRGGSSATVRPDSVVAIDVRSNEIVRSFRAGRDPGQVRAVGGAVYVASQGDATVSRIDMETGDVLTSGAHAAGGSIAGAGQRIWVASPLRGEVTWVRPGSLGAVDRIRIRRDLAHAFVAVGAGSLWVSENAPPAVSRISLRTHRLQRRYSLEQYQFPVEVTFGAGAAWVGLGFTDELLRIDGATGQTSRIPVGPGPSDPVVGFGAVWSGTAGDGTVWRVDAVTQRVEDVVEVGGVTFGLAVGAGSVWVTDYCDGVVARIDPRTNEVVARIRTDWFPKWLAVGGGRVWVGVAGEDALGFPACSEGRAG